MHLLGKNLKEQYILEWVSVSDVFKRLHDCLEYICQTLRIPNQSAGIFTGTNCIFTSTDQVNSSGCSDCVFLRKRSLLASLLLCPSCLY